MEKECAHTQPKGLHAHSAQMWALLCLHPPWPGAAWPKVSNVALIKRNIPYPRMDFQIHLLLISLWFNLIKLGTISNIDFNKILIKIRAIIKHNFSDHCRHLNGSDLKKQFAFRLKKGFFCTCTLGHFRKVTSWSFFISKDKRRDLTSTYSQLNLFTYLIPKSS